MLSPNTQANAMTRYKKYSEISISISYGQATLWVWVMLSNLWMGDHKQISSWIGLEGIAGQPWWLQKHFLIATLPTMGRRSVCWKLRFQLFGTESRSEAASVPGGEFLLSISSWGAVIRSASFSEASHPFVLTVTKSPPLVLSKPWTLESTVIYYCFKVSRLFETSLQPFTC